MELEFEKLLLSELRMAVYEKNEGGPQALTDEAMVLAVTANEELRQLGYTLKPQDIVKLAKSPSLTAFPVHFRSLIPSVDAKPMYPDFPKQVMAMDEAEFRFHQVLHYFSTYGMEFLTGQDVLRGWLPDMPETEKTESDKILLDAKAVELIPEDRAPLIAAERVLGRRNRLNKTDRLIVRYAIPLLTSEDIAGIRVPFKENLTELFYAILVTTSGETRLDSWRRICSHTGDVIKCVQGILPRCGHHLRTSQKRAIVKLLESYPADDFRSNLILSRGKREKSINVLQFLDYNMYSRSDEHREAVRALRSGELRSWEAQAKCMLTSGDDGALDFIAARPGMMLRMLNWLLDLGYTPEELTARLYARADKLSLTTMVNVINAMDLVDKCVPDEGVYRERIGEVRECAELKRNRCLENHASDDPEHVTLIMRDIERQEQRRISELGEEYESDLRRYERLSTNTGTIRGIMKLLITKHLEGAKTDIRGKKVYTDAGCFDLAASRMTASEKSDDGGYLPDGIIVHIPDEVKYLRMFVYWNDKSRVDVDLHVVASAENGDIIHVGWSGEYNDTGIVHSGDITESDAAEYIDIDLSAPVRHVSASIHLYDGKECFGDIETCYVGLMAVSSIEENVKLYDPANCFFTHELRSRSDFMNYGSIDVQHRVLCHGGSVNTWTQFSRATGFDFADTPSLTTEDYLKMLISAQEAEFAASADDAEVILTLDKSQDERAVSLVDRNFYLEA